MLPNGIISLTTDFGADDPYVGIMKAVIVGCFPNVRIIDLTHQVPAYQPDIAGLFLGLSCRWFPFGTVHLAVVDPAVGTDRDIILLVADAHWFLAPDNGLADEIGRHVTILARRRVDTSRPATTRVSSTFHGRDIFAPLAASLAADEIRPEDVGPVVPELAPSSLQKPRRCGTRVEGEILLADHFGNLLTNIPGALLGHREAAAVQCGGHSFRVVRTYGNTTGQEPVALINSFDLLELACPRGDAARILGLTPGEPVTVQVSG